ncbi:MAG: glutamate--tRNA ligase [Patescibacteria group bacterium]
MSDSVVRTRVAPSPTGEMHVGSLSIVLKNYAYAKRHHGQFVLRIEDTDQTREVPGAQEQIISILDKFHLPADEGPIVGGPFAPYVQSQRLEIYRLHAQQLIEKGQAYYCFCSKDRLEKLRDQQRADHLPPKYDRLCRNLSPQEVKSKLDKEQPYVIRLKVPDHQKVSFTDLIRGQIEFDSDQVDDQVLIKSDGFPTYHLAVVVDDHLMQISHVMRGEEWISSTPKHILLYQAFNWPLPVYAHIPIYLNPNGKGKMSKRHGTVSVGSFLDQGYLPEALLNFLMILGWATNDEREILTLDEYILEFNPQDISQKTVVFDLKKLQWLNGIYIRNLTNKDLISKLKPFVPTDFPSQFLPQVLPLIKERLVVLSDFEDLTAFIYRPIEINQKDLLKKSSANQVAEQLDQLISTLSSLSAQNWLTLQLEEKIRNLQEKQNWSKGQFFMMVRVAITGQTQTPPLFETMAVIGHDLTLSRLNQALLTTKKVT